MSHQKWFQLMLGYSGQDLLWSTMDFHHLCPHNPTGKVCTKDELEAIVATCQRRDVLAITDELVNSVNTDGDTPLHVLAKKPNVLKNNSNFGLHDTIIYYAAFVDDLMDVKFGPRSNKSDYSLDSEIKLPENWRPCENIFVLLTTPIVKSFLASRGRDNKQNGN